MWRVHCLLQIVFPFFVIIFLKFINKYCIICCVYRDIREGNKLQYITNLDKNKLGKYKEKLLTEEIILTDERLYEHILLYHEEEYKQLRPYIKSIIDNPDYIIEDNRHKDTLIYLKHIHSIEKSSRVVIKLALVQDNEHNKNSIITLMKLNKRTWNQTIRNRGKIIWKNKQSGQK